MDISIFMGSFKENLLRLFGDNLLFLGLQGSYGRGEAKEEAKETSDIDPVIILQQCGKDEILKYRGYIDTLPEKDILCGFISSIDELRAWESADRAQLIFDTKPVYRDLAELCWSILPELYKSSRFTIRMKHYLQTDVYVSAFRELITVVDEEEKAILETQNPDAENDAFILLEWASKAMRYINTD